MAVILTKTGTDQAAGTEVTETVPTGEVWKLLAVRFQLVSSGTAATRTVTLNIDDGSNIVWRRTSPGTQTASLTRNYLYLADLVGEDAAFDGNGDIKLFLPSTPLLPGWRVRTITTNIQAGDNFGAPLLHYVKVGYMDDMVVHL